MNSLDFAFKNELVVVYLLASFLTEKVKLMR